MKKEVGESPSVLGSLRRSIKQISGSAQTGGLADGLIDRRRVKEREME